MESVKSSIKERKSLISKVSYIGDYVRIVLFFVQHFFIAVFIKILSTWTYFSQNGLITPLENQLQQYVLENGVDKRSVIWKPIYSLENFPRLNEDKNKT